MNKQHDFDARESPLSFYLTIRSLQMITGNSSVADAGSLPSSITAAAAEVAFVAAVDREELVVVVDVGGTAVEAVVD